MQPANQATTDQEMLGKRRTAGKVKHQREMIHTVNTGSAADYKPTPRTAKLTQQRQTE